MSNLKTSTGVDMKECFACRQAYPITYLQTLGFDEGIKMNFCYNCMPDKKRNLLSIRSEAKLAINNRNGIDDSKSYYNDLNKSHLLNPQMLLKPNDKNKRRRMSLMPEDHLLSQTYNFENQISGSEKSSKNSPRFQSQKSKISSTSSKQSKSKYKDSLKESVIDSFRKVKHIKLPYIKDKKLITETLSESKFIESSNNDVIKLRSKVLKTNKSVAANLFRLSKIKDNSINKSIAESKTTIIESKLEAQVESPASNTSSNENLVSKMKIQMNRNKLRIKKLPKK